MAVQLDRWGALGEQFGQSLGQGMVKGYQTQKFNQAMQEQGLDLNTPEGMYGAAQLFMQQGDYDRALKFYTAGQEMAAAGATGRSYNLNLMRNTETGVEYYEDPRNPGIYYDSTGKQIAKPEGRSVKVGTGAEEGQVAGKEEKKTINTILSDYGIDVEDNAILVDDIKSRMAKGRSASQAIQDLMKEGKLSKNPDAYFWQSDWNYSPTAAAAPAPTVPNPYAASSNEEFMSKNPFGK